MILVILKCAQPIMVAATGMGDVNIFADNFQTVHTCVSVLMGTGWIVTTAPVCLKVNEFRILQMTRYYVGF